MARAGWVSIAWLWSDASELVWAAYGVTSRIGRFMDRRGGIPLGRIALDEFEMLGEQQPHGSHGVNRFDLPPQPARPTHRMSAEQHAVLGTEVQGALQQLSRPWPFPKSHRRSVCRSRLRTQLERLQSMASGCATREHGDVLAHEWYYAADVGVAARGLH